MSQDSHSGYNPDPEKPYDIPSTYEMPSQPFYEAPPYQYPYQFPLQSPYGAQQQFPYDMPLQGAYGTPDYNPPQGSYDYEVSSPLPLSKAMRQLPNQYIRVLIKKPSFNTFAAEMGKASWTMVWLQCIIYPVIGGILIYLRTYVTDLLTGHNTLSNALNHMAMLQTIPQKSFFVGIIIVLTVLFIGQGVTYLCAKAFGGTGTFLKQSYTYLLILVPIGIISSLLGFIPILGTWITCGLGIYSCGLQISSLMAVHHLSQQKATAVFLTTFGIFMVLVVIFIIIAVIAIFYLWSPFKIL